ncbi:hypothetical protein BDZ91DRAFT_730524 [Kalaharituber pfeilii]|nr:hypothetical protein BDZ91DRAFT_730524 [Kalaharituber pfeilii]
MINTESDTDTDISELTPLPSYMESSDFESDDEDWENCLHNATEPRTFTGTIPSSASGDLEITLDNNTSTFSTTGKKGISAIERQIRMACHKLHVQFLLYHGFRRNSWLEDEELQAILLSHLAPGVSAQIEKYQYLQKQADITHRQKAKEQAKEKGKRKEKSKETTNVANLDSSKPNSGAIDPLIHLLGVLIHFWKKRFRVTAPGLRKYGYRTLTDLNHMLSANESSENAEAPAEAGERITNLNVYRNLAMKLEGSRDVGAQLFTALLRALGLKARMIFSFQPIGFSFHANEMATPRTGSQDSNTVHSNENNISNVTTIQKNVTEKIPARKKRKLSAGTEKLNLHNTDDSESEVDLEKEKGSVGIKKIESNRFDKDLYYPIFWTEVFSPGTGCWIPVDALVTTKVYFRPEMAFQLEPKGKLAENSRQVICYVVGYSSDFTAKDVTVRYLSNNIVPGKTKGFRVAPTIYSIKDSHGSVIRDYKYDWFRSVMRSYSKPDYPQNEADQDEDELLEGVAVEPYKNNPEFVLERHLKREEAVKPGKSHVRLLTIGKGEKAKQEKIYRRKDIAICKTIENWYREGRIVKQGEQPLKRVKTRAVTLNRKRELEKAAADNSPIQQGLYSFDQTKLYEPPPLKDGKVPRNAFGNCDVYVSTMIPNGCTHLPLKGSGKIAKKLGIDYADAVTGFEFKKQRAMPVIEGIVVAAEYEGLLRDAWTADEKEKRRKENVKREQAALALWRKFLMGIRIVKRLREEYGSENERGDSHAMAVQSESNPEKHKYMESKHGSYLHDQQAYHYLARNIDNEGGFLRGEDDDLHQRYQLSDLNMEEVMETQEDRRFEDLNEPLQPISLRCRSLLHSSSHDMLPKRNTRTTISNIGNLHDEDSAFFADTDQSRGQNLSPSPRLNRTTIGSNGSHKNSCGHVHNASESMDVDNLSRSAGSRLVSNTMNTIRASNPRATQKTPMDNAIPEKKARFDVLQNSTGKRQATRQSTRVRTRSTYFNADGDSAGDDEIV